MGVVILIAVAEGIVKLVKSANLVRFDKIPISEHARVLAEHRWRQ